MEKRRHLATNKRDGLLFSVYVIQAGEYIKVGIAEDVLKRLQVFRTHCPMPVSMVYCSKPVLRPEARRIELLCHGQLGFHHVHGEWFRTDPAKAVWVLGQITERVVREEVTPQLKLLK